MRTEGVDERLLQKYLLGSLSEEEQVQVEDRAFMDAGYLVAVETAEADLIDAYVRGQLPPQDRRRFEARFFLSSQRRSKVEFARALAQIAAETKVTVARPSAWQAFVETLRAWRPAMQLAAGAAMLLLAAGVGWLAVENGAERSRVAALESQQRAAESREAALRQQLAQEQARGANPPETQKPAAGGERKPLLAALVFLPNLSRAAGTAQQLTLTPDATMAHLEIQLEARDEFPRFRAELHTRGGEDILTRANLTRQRTAAGYSVAFDVPASALPGGDYELALKGVAGDQTTDIGYYYFRVRRQ